MRRAFRRSRKALLVCLGVLLLPVAGSRAADPYESAPILYSSARPENVISRLQDRLDAGETPLEYDEQKGWLPSLLDVLQVPIESQMLVYSQTSLQRHRISPRTPRALYFNDDVYIGYCHRGDVIEISVADPKIGTAFYTLEQQSRTARFDQQTDSCLICHSSSRTDSVPGHLVRSMFVNRGGQPLFSAGSFTVDHTTPLKNRWGGWYVTGTHGEQSHLGNVIINGRDVPRDFKNEDGVNVVTLDSRVDASDYMTPHSDLIALMVFEHQTLVHNRITKANFAARQALFYEAELNRALGEPEDNRLESTGRRIASAGDDLVEALLLVNETELTAPLVGTSGYQELFEELGPFDSRGRSLRDLDLERRLFTYPCSYLIYSEAFCSLPEEMREYVWDKLWRVLTADDEPKKYSHLSSEDRTAIVELLVETHPDVPDSWKAALASSGN